MSLISVTAPGDVIGAITAGFNMLAETAKAVTAVAGDQSGPGLQLKADLATALALPMSIMAKLDQLLGVKVQQAISPAPETPPK